MTFKKDFLDAMKMLANKKGGDIKWYSVRDNDDNDEPPSNETNKISLTNTIFKAKNRFELWLKVYKFLINDEEWNDYKPSPYDLEEIEEYSDLVIAPREPVEDAQLYSLVENLLIRNSIISIINSMDNPEMGYYIVCFKNLL